MSLSKRLMRYIITSAIVSTSITFSNALYVGEVDASNLNLRTSANGTIIDTIARGTKVAVISNSSEWYKIAVNGQTYYANGTYIDWVPECDFEIGTGTIKCDTTVNFRSQPNTSSSIISSLKNGQKVSVIGVYGGWYKVSSKGSVGYIHPDYLEINSNTNERPSNMKKDDVVGTVVDTSLDTDEIRKSIVDYSATLLGTPYKYAGNTPQGFDCSGFTSYVYKEAAGISLSRTSSGQRDTIENISMDELLPGDLVFFGSNNIVNHVGIYVGNGNFIHSPHSGSVVRYDTLETGNYNLRFICGGRVV